jgi:hypothetical protein
MYAVIHLDTTARAAAYREFARVLPPLDADEEVAALGSAGLALVARLDRSPHDGLEPPSHRSYLVVGR